MKNHEKHLKETIVNNLKEGNSIPYVEFLTNNPGFKLYKYRICSDNNFTALKNSQLWMSAANFMDDTYDSGFLTCENWDEIYNLICKKYPRFSEYKYSSVIDAKGKFLQKDTLVLCFGQSDHNEDLWKRYANNHEGFCIEYEMLSFFKKGLLPFPVIYTTIQKSITDFFYKSKCYNIFDIILTKNKSEWEQQEEWRIFAWRKNFNLSDDKKGCLISAPIPSKIYYGKNISQSNLIRLKEIAKSLKIQLIRER